MEESNGLNLAHPPRTVPVSVVIKNVLGGALNRWGWIMLGIASIVFWSHVTRIDVTPLIYRGNWEIATGRLEKVEPSGYREWYNTGSGQSHSERTIYALHYVYGAPDGNEYHGTSYSTNDLKVGSHPVEYQRNNPRVSRIKGERRAPYVKGSEVGSAALIVIIMLLGLICIYKGLTRGLLAVKLLSGGMATYAVVKGKKEIIKSEKKTSYLLTYSYRAQDNHSYEITGTTSQDIQEGDKELLLYDPVKPSRALLLTSVRGEPSISAKGTMLFNDQSAVSLDVIIPMITAVIIAVSMAIRFS